MPIAKGKIQFFVLGMHQQVSLHTQNFVWKSINFDPITDTVWLTIRYELLQCY